MIDLNFDKNMCTGCGACVALCPVSAIRLKCDFLGYFYPVVDYDLCLNCELCLKRCPERAGAFLSMQDNDKAGFKQSAFSAISKSQEIWKKSSSGGAFTSICKVYADYNTVIFGAKYDNTHNVVHDYIIGLEKIYRFQKSKYVHSYIDKSIYREIKNRLSKGEKVIFSGVSCQVAGLRNYLGKYYPTLLCVDLVCMGSGAPSVFKSYIKELEETRNKKIKKYIFREKRIKYGRISEFLVSLLFADGSKEIIINDAYNTSFIEGLHTQPSCHSCIYKTLDRVGDITIADFKRREHVYPFDKDLRNLSAIIVNTSLGEKVVSKLSEEMNIRQVSIDILKNNILPLTCNSPVNKNRESFIKDFRQGDKVTLLTSKYKKKSSILMKIWCALPDRLRGIIKLVLK